MKTFSLLLLATLLLTIFYSQEPAELQEASTLTETATKLFNQGKYAEAISPAKRALELREKLLPRTDPRVASALSNLGEIYLGKKDYKPAREVFLRLLQIQEEVFGPEDVNLVFTLDRLAVIYFVGGNFEETEAAYKRSLALREKSLGVDDPQVGEVWFALGEFYRYRRKLEPAVASYKRALTIYGKRSIDSAEFERTSDGFACLGYDHRKPELFKELTAIRKQLAGPDGPKDPEPGMVLNGRAIELPQPSYPAEAQQRRLMGMIVVKVEIDETGKVIKATDMCQGLPYLSEAAVAAAWKARFTPTKLSGMPVKVKGVIQYNFTRRFR